MDNLNQFSEDLLLKVKLGDSTEDLVNQFAKLDQSDLLTLLADDQKKAFWINIYNAFYQLLAISHTGIGKEIYRIKAIKIAGHQYSLDDIEHGILRRGKHKYSLGFWSSFRKYRHVRHLRPRQLDFRIHFALNCGAKSCPPIAFYAAEKLNEQLDQATLSFLTTETEFNHTSKTVKVSRLFLWFYNDFGKRKGINQILQKYLGQNPVNYKLIFAEYDWTEQLSNYAKYV